MRIFEDILQKSEKGLSEILLKSPQIYKYECEKALSRFYKPTTITVDDNIQQFSLPSTISLMYNLVLWNNFLEKKDRKTNGLGGLYHKVVLRFKIKKLVHK